MPTAAWISRPTQLPKRDRPHVDYDAPRPGYVLSGPSRRIAEVVELWLLPFVGWPVAWLAWQSLGYSTAQVTVAMLVPVLVMTGVVYWGTQVKRGWSFPVPYAPNGFLVWIGVIYSATEHLVLLCASPLLTLGLGPVANALLFVLAGGLLGGVAGCTFDYFALKYDILRVFVRPFREGRPPAEVVPVYGPKFFTLVALCVATSTALIFSLS